MGRFLCHQVLRRSSRCVVNASSCIGTFLESGIFFPVAIDFWSWHPPVRVIAETLKLKANIIGFFCQVLVERDLRAWASSFASSLGKFHCGDIFTWKGLLLSDQQGRGYLKKSPVTIDLGLKRPHTSLRNNCQAAHTGLILVAFITGNSSLEPLIEGLYAQIHVILRWRVFGRNRTGDLTDY